jgi:hypothetical protein
MDESRHTPLLRARGRAVTLGVTLSLILAACGGGGGGAKKGRSASATSSSEAIPTTTTTAAPTYPLTGLPATDPAILGRPALIVKIENAPEARPQSGLDAADVVVEEKVEGGIVRFMVIFQSRDADPVGPVRSLRSTDPPVVTPIGGLFAYSGGIRPFIALLHQAPVVDVGVDSAESAYYRRPGRPAPHNLYSSTARLRQHTPAGTKPPPALFSYLDAGEAFVPAGVGLANHLDVPVGSMTSATWDWDPQGGFWRRGTNGTPHTVEGGAQLGFTNVILQYVPYRNTGQFDVVREPVDEAAVVGSGDAIVLSQGKVVKATWAKSSAADITHYADAAGQAIKLARGTTWVMLAPVGAPFHVQ